MATTERAPAPRVLLGVTGGIAAYKSPELVRRLVERGCEVQVVMSRGAHREQPGENGILVGHASDELPQRAFYRRWRELMAAGS